ncbi:hypothetical protein [Legionella brunensis]|uniref:Uncharacterized protein n=1 Tax=Legionella brunensis TaxID=29422 RepID=A0A0W0SD11_9GAMM|nr:hypothetical protein [Legionella brunensis]KTC81404.1 hypothetical protein Lbru_1924 [Legionella brunensis]
MPRINQDLLERIPEEKRWYLGYYPDVLLYQDDKHEYSEAIYHLANAKYLYANGYNIRPASTLRYAFEAFKGWLGFNNHCETQKVQLGLYKFAYYGYLKGYPQGALHSLQRHGVSEQFIRQFSSPRKNDVTQKIQNDLIKFYADHVQASVIPEGQPKISDEYSFGNTWANLELWSEIPKLDPQNDLLIQRTISQLENMSSLPNYVSIQNSKYAFEVAKQCIEHVKSRRNTSLAAKFLNYVLNLSADNEALIARAIQFAPDICLQDKQFFIAFYLERKNFKAALPLIELLEDTTEAAILVKKHFNNEQVLALIKKDSPLAAALSEQYLTADTENLKTIKFVATFYPSFAQKFPAQALRLLVSEEKYEEAYQLFTGLKDCQIYVDDLVKLADYFEDLSLSKEKAAVALREQQNWIGIETPILQAIRLIKKALELDENDDRSEKHYRQLRLYAESLINNDIVTHEIETCQIEQIIKAINLLNQCKPVASNEKKLHQKVLVTGLMRQVDYLIYTISPLAIDAESHTKLAEHNDKHSDNIRNTAQLLRKIIDLCNDTSDKELKLILGKANFLYGDLIKFFGLNENCNPYFRAAMKAVPNNPFYILRCSEIFEEEKDKLREKGVPLLRALGYEPIHYLRWDEQRWYKDKSSALTPIQDIHNLGEKGQKRSFSFSLI